eukprot:7092650-Prymnesium_polylepis.1
MLSHSPSATASHQHSSLESSVVPCAMHMCSSRKDTATQHAKQPKRRGLASAYNRSSLESRVERSTMRDAHVL